MESTSKKIIAVNSDSLLWLRRLIKGSKPLRDLIGDLVQFRLVIDANCILEDLIWLVKKRKNPKANTEIQECILAGTFIVYCTKTVIKEVNEHLKDIASQHNIPIDSLKKEWKSYKAMLKIKEPDKVIIDKYKNPIDPDDIPTLALAELLSADAIISKDRDLKSMGGKVLQTKPVGDKGVLVFEFCASARDYSRKATVTAILKVGGAFSIVVGFETFKIISGIIAQIVVWIEKLPAWIKIILVAATFLALLHPKSREFMLKAIRNIVDAFKESMPVIFEIINKIEMILAENKPITPIIE
jgi:predicted nucleic acid-binding protein